MNYTFNTIDLKIIADYLNFYLGDEYVYRVNMTDEYLALTFYDESMANEFLAKSVSKFTCDTSSLFRNGLTIFIGDFFIRNRLLNNCIKFYEKYNAENSSASSTEQV